MKTKIFTIVAIAMLSVASLQAQVNFGVVAGPNFQNITGKDHYGDKLENGLIVGFHAGVKANIPIATDFFFQTGLLYSCKGSKNDFLSTATKSTASELYTTTRIGYVELPLNLLFRPEFGNGHILLGFGPYLALGITGKQVYEVGDFSYEQKIKFSSRITWDEYWDMDHAYYRPFDAGANIFAGYELEMGLFFQLNAQMGLLRINPEIEEAEDDDAAYRNTGFGISIGYNF
jgi:hypothetical protein